MSADTLTITQAAEALDLSRQQVHRLIQEGQLDAEKRPGWPWAIERASLDYYAAHRPNEGRRSEMTKALVTALTGHLVDLLDSEFGDDYTWEHVKVMNARGWTLETSGKSGTQEWINRHEGVSLSVPDLKRAYGDALAIVNGTAALD